uniref:Uncharacterized protein n=1 Tax=viral metagenome TaxID=1070528 RepID=A0A6M3KHE7_9ZZZZ
MNDSKPRFSFEVTEEQQQRALQVFKNYGDRKAVMGRILDELMDMVEEHGYIVFGAIFDQSANIRKIIPSLAKAEKIASKMEDR